MSNMYNFISATRNPLGGECKHKCEYCYVNNLKNRFSVINERYSGEPRIIYSEIDKIAKDKNKIIFICSCNDLFADNVPTDIIVEIINACNQNPKNKYFFQTKNPERFIKFINYFQCVFELCVTIESDIYHKAMKNSPAPLNRLHYLRVIANEYKFFNIHITIEPIMQFSLGFEELLANCNPYQINIGANTNKKVQLLEPSEMQIESFVNNLRKQLPATYFNTKLNLSRLYPYIMSL